MHVLNYLISILPFLWEAYGDRKEAHVWGSLLCGATLKKSPFSPSLSCRECCQ